MGHNLVEKLIASHLVSGKMTAGKEISIRIDQTLTQDSLGTMAYLQFEAMDVERVKTKLSVSYVDHLTLQEGFENADDHKYLKTVADKYGIVFSKPGNGICHQLHLERMSRPGWTLLGSDSHTPTAGAAGMLAMREAGAHTIAQDEESCVIYGMPGEAVKLGAAIEEAPLTGIPNRIIRSLTRESVKERF
jgi:aconitate hydratase